MENKSIGSNWADVRKEMFTDEEISVSNMRVAVINKFITARKKKDDKLSCNTKKLFKE